jgi:hypothetical protein
MIKRRSIIGIIGAALLAPKACFAQKQLLPETQMIIDTVKSCNLKNTEIIFFRLNTQKLVGIYFWNNDLERVDAVMCQISGANSFSVLKELASYFGGKITCSNNKNYGLKVSIS